MRVIDADHLYSRLGEKDEFDEFIDLNELINTEPTLRNIYTAKQVIDILEEIKHDIQNRNRAISIIQDKIDQCTKDIITGKEK